MASKKRRNDYSRQNPFQCIYIYTRYMTIVLRQSFSIMYVFHKIVFLWRVLTFKKCMLGNLLICWWCFFIAFDEFTEHSSSQNNSISQMVWKYKVNFKLEMYSHKVKDKGLVTTGLYLGFLIISFFVFSVFSF